MNYRRFLVAIAVVVVAAVAIVAAAYWRQMMNPVPFLTEKEKLDHRSYVAIARKLHEFDGLGLSKNLKTREDLISELIKSKIYSQEEIDMMADANCQNTNLLFDDGIVFWRFREKSVSFVNRAWGAHLESKKSFDSRFKHDKNAR